MGVGGWGSFSFFSPLVEQRVVGVVESFDGEDVVVDAHGGK